jgi:hypothetical protein
MSLSQLAALTLGVTPKGRAPAVPPLPFTRFVLDPTTLGLLEGPLVAADEPYAQAPAGAEARPQSLLLTGRVRVGATGIPLRCRPLFPGRMMFRGTGPGARPQPGDVAREAYPGWATEGVLMVDLLAGNGKAVSRDVLLRWSTMLASALEEATPTRMWYAPVRIPESFLFDALPLLAPRDAPPPGANGQLTQGHRQRISEFLGGTWGPVMGPPSRTGGGIVDDPVSAPWMPRLVVAADLGVSLRITAATAVTPFDGTMAALEAAAEVNVSRDHPAHPANATLPARLIYQTVAAAGGLTQPLPASVGIGSRTYRRVKVTRIWKPEPDCSVHFPAQAIVLKGADGSEAARQRLAAHGLLFHGFQPADAALAFTLTLTDMSATGSHPLRWLTGGHVGDDDSLGQAWQRTAAVAPVPVDLTGPAGVHVIARLPMSRAVFAADTQPFPAPGGLRCTYLSMRRADRALIDNRIAGGRLSFDGNATKRATSKLIDDAMAPHRGRFFLALEDFRGKRTLPAGRLLTSVLVANGNPGPGEDEGRAAWFLPFWEAFFPDRMPAENVPGSFPRTEVMRRGKVAYLIWQSVGDRFADPHLTQNFPSNVIGRGGPGGLVVSGLADGFFAHPPIIEDRDLTPAERDAIVAPLISRTLTAGSVLQYWIDLDTFNSVRTRKAGFFFGHSPIFLRVDPEAGNPSGITVVDQNGMAVKVLRNVGGARQLGAAQIWIAAEWNE